MMVLVKRFFDSHAVGAAYLER